MNIIDIVILAVIGFALFEGIREGIIIQGLSFIGIAVGIWLGSKLGSPAATMLNIGGDFAPVWGFVIVLLVTIVGVAIGARLLRKLLRFAGFGLVDIILGAALSVCKYLLILAMLFSAFDMVNHSYSLVDHKQFDQSKLYRPIANISKWATPAWNWTQQQLKSSSKQFDEVAKDIEKRAKDVEGTIKEWE